MANNFANDANCVALYRFENGALTTDSGPVGTNTLNPNNSPSADIVNFKEGSGSTSLVAASTQFYNLTDSNQSSGFPLKSGTTNKLMSICGWFKLGTTSNNRGLFGKVNQSGSVGCGLYVYNSSLYISYNGGWQNTGLSVSANIWYHVGMIYNGTNGQATVRLFKSDDSTLQSASFGLGALNVGAVDFVVGTFSDNTSWMADSNFDEVVVFNRLLVPGEIDSIRTGIFPTITPQSHYTSNNFTGDPNCISVYRFENGALTTDSFGTNTLTAVNAPTCDTNDNIEGSGSTALAYASKQFYKITDANLSSSFPLKSGDSVMLGTFACWFKLSSTGGNVPAIIGKGAYGGAGLNLYHNAGSLQVSWNGTACTALTNLSTGIWYHAAIVFNGKSRTCYVRLYNSSTGSATTYIVSGIPASDLILTAEFRVGAWSGTDTDRTFDGKIDEVVVFNRGLSVNEIDAIRQGTYSYVSPIMATSNDFSRDKTCVNQYLFEPGALTTDTKGFVTLNASTSAPTSYTTEYKQGSGCVMMQSGYNQYFYVTDANLPTGAFCKSADADVNLFTICCWLKRFDYGQRTILGKWVSGQYVFILYTDPTSHNIKMGMGTASYSQWTWDTGIQLLPNEWYHLALSFDWGASKNTMIRLYQASTNKVYGNYYQGYLSSSSFWISGTADFRIGSNQDSTTNSWNGLMDEFLIFYRFLNIEEIDAIRSGTYTGPMVPQLLTASQIFPGLSFAAAVNNPTLNFSHGGDAVWSIHNNETHDLGFSVKSGTIGLNQESWFSTTVKGPGKLIFWWAVDSTANHHYLQFQIDGVAQDSISGPNNPGVWVKKSYSIAAGTHTLKWRYYTDGTAASGRNAGYVDEISFGPGNDFTNDSNCISVYKGDSIHPGFDSKGTNHLRNGHGVRFQGFTNQIRKSGYLYPYYSRGASQYLTLDDSSLSASFPLKSTDTSKVGTFCFWFLLNNSSSYTYFDLLSKGTISARCFGIYFYSGYGLYVNWGYSGGNQDIKIADYTLFSVNHWYHICVSFDGVNKRLYCRVWDDEAQKIIVDQTWTPTNAMVVQTGGFTVGANLGCSNTWDGYIDEVVVFNKQLTISQMDAVRKGVYSGTGPTSGNDFSSDSTCKALWRFESGQKTTDSKSTNTLTDHGTVQITNVANTTREGSGCVQTTYSGPTWLHIADSNLASGFPLKSDDTTKVASICCWFRPLENNQNYRHLMAKMANNTTGTFMLYTNSATALVFRWYYGTGNTYQEFILGYLPNTYAWYHLGLTIDGVNQKVTSRLYNSFNETSTCYEFYPGEPLQICSADLTISGAQGATSGTLLASTGWNGYIDEVVIFNRILNFLEIDAIRLGTYSGTGKSGATDLLYATIVYKTIDHKTYFCVDPDRGRDCYGGLNFQQPMRNFRGKYFGPGDVITFAKTYENQMYGTASVTSGSTTVTVNTRLDGALYAGMVIRFGSDTVYYTVQSFSVSETNTTLTLYRPYRGSTASGVNYYVAFGTWMNWYLWNTYGLTSYADKPVQFIGGYDRDTQQATGIPTIFEQYGNYGWMGACDFIVFKKIGFTNWSNYGINIGGRGAVFEDIFLSAYFMGSYPPNGTLAVSYNSRFDRFIFEAQAWADLTNGMFNCEFNDWEFFPNSNYPIQLGVMKNVVFNRFRTGGGSYSLALNSSFENTVFYDPIFDEGSAVSVGRFYMTNSTQLLGNIAFINASLNPSVPLFYFYSTAGYYVGDVCFEHYNQTQNDDRVYIFNGAYNNYAAVQYRDTTTFRTSAPSLRLEFTGVSPVSVMPVTRTFYLPADQGVATTVSAYVRVNPAYFMAGRYLLPTMTVRVIQGSAPNFTWSTPSVSITKTSNQWLQLTQQVTPSTDAVLEVTFTFLSSNPSAIAWLDEIEKTP